MSSLFRTDFRSFHLLNATQFLGALNDNIFKLLVIYFLIYIQGPEFANTILSLAGAIFVVPFLLFSSGAGVLADKISKRTVLVICKVFEVSVMIFAIVTIYLKWGFGAYIALFLLATHSALFGPAKYGIIPELVESKMVSRANGSIASLTYLAIILGTFLASFFTDVTDKNFTLIAIFCLVIAFAGLLTALGIIRTEPQRSTKKINPFFLYEIYQTLKMSWNISHLLPCIFGSSFFLFVGAFTQLNIIPFAMESLHLTDVGGGYLFLATAMGIAIGAFLSGKIAKDKVEPGLSCIAGFFIAFFFVLLALFSFSLTMTIIILTLLGIVGGSYLIPFDSFIQINSPDQKRGQVIATSNFFSFVGVFMAAVYLYFVSEELGLSAAHSFALIGVLSFFINFIVLARLSSLFFSFFARKILKHFRTLQWPNHPLEQSQVFIVKSNSWLDIIALFEKNQKIKILLPGSLFRQFPWVNSFFDTIDIVPTFIKDLSSLQKIATSITKAQNNNEKVCIFVHKKKDADVLIDHYSHVLSKLHFQTQTFFVEKRLIPTKFLFFSFLKKQILFSTNIEK